MKTSSRSIRQISSLIFIALLPTLASAHGIWFAQRSGDMALVYGHGAEDLDIIKRIPKVQALHAFDDQGKPVTAAWKQTDRLLLVESPAKPAALATSLDNGLWSKGPDGKWVAKGKDEVPGATESGRYIKYTVYLSQPLPVGSESLPGQTLQIIPLAKEFPHHSGKPMKFKVLFEGKPAAGAKVGLDYVGDPEAKPVVTGKDGIVTLKVRNQGLNVISAAYDSKPQDPAKAAKTGHFATLAFALHHKEE
jgi:nickel transport protein